MEEAPHPTLDIPLKMISVDKGIIPIVEWLNSLDGVTTDFCCQGSEMFKDEHGSTIFRGQKPYVVFYCRETLSLITILTVVSHAATVEVEFYHGSLRYVLEIELPSAFEAILGMASNMLRQRS